MLNRLFPLRKPPLFLTGNINQDGWNTNQNQMKNTCFFYIVFQVWKVLLKELVRHTYQIFYFLLFYTVILAFTTSADIIFHKFLELHSTSEKKMFVTIFPFLTNSLKPPTLNDQNPLSMMKDSCRCSFIFFAVDQI